jgi:glutathione S-transferase
LRRRVEDGAPGQPEQRGDVVSGRAPLLRARRATAYTWEPHADPEVSTPMVKLYHAPRTRSARIYWLLEELGIPYELEQVAFVPPLPPLKPFAQATPKGKFPTIEDGDVVMFESGAILEYLIEQYGKGRLAPAPGSPLRGPYLQWVHFAEGTAFPPLANLAWHMFKGDADQVAGALADYRQMAAAAFDVLERALDGKAYLLGAEFSGADVMIGYTVECAKWFGLLGDRYPNLTAYASRLEARPAFQKAFS